MNNEWRVIFSNGRTHFFGSRREAEEMIDTYLDAADGDASARLEHREWVPLVTRTNRHGN